MSVPVVYWYLLRAVNSLQAYYKALRLYFNRVFLNIAVSALKLSKGEGNVWSIPHFRITKINHVRTKAFCLGSEKCK